MTEISLTIAEIPQDLRQAMYEAYDALAAQRAKLDRLKAARAAVADDIAKAKADLAEAKAAYVAEFEADVQGGDANPRKPQERRAAVAEIGGRIYAAEQTLPDFDASIAAAKVEMEPLRSAFNRARMQVVRQVRRGVPRYDTPLSKKLSLADVLVGDVSFDLDSVALMYLAHYYDMPPEGGQAFTAGEGPARFFAFLGNFFRPMEANEIAAQRNRLEAMIWGDREPEPRVKMPDNPPPKDTLGSGVIWPP